MNLPQFLVLLLITVIGAFLSVFFLKVWPFSDNGLTSTLTMTPTAVPTHLPNVPSSSPIGTVAIPIDASLTEMLRIARSVYSSADRDIALRLVSETAIKRGDYGTAIIAAKDIYSSSARSDTLVTIARSAIAAGLFEYAGSAADIIPYSSTRDDMKLEIIRARQLPTPTFTPLAPTPTFAMTPTLTPEPTVMPTPTPVTYALYINGGNVAGQAGPLVENGYVKISPPPDIYSPPGAPFRYQTSRYLAGVRVSLTAIPDEGFGKVQWGGDCIGSSPTCSFIMNKDRSVSILFIRNTPTPSPTPLPTPTPVSTLQK